MADEPGGNVPEPVRAWLAEVAESEGLSEQELFGRLLSADGEGVPGSVEAPGSDVDGRLDELEAAIADLDADLDRKIDDVRDRVVQLKLEGETKAPEDHDHPEVAAGVDRLVDRTDAIAGDLEAAVDRFDERLEAVEERTEEGFANFEEVLEYLVETTDDLHERVATLAEATLDQRERLGRLAAAEARRAAADELRGTAADHGVTTAACESCGESVPLGLLAAPECPHCGVQFTELEPRRGFFRSSVLHAGQRPALEGEVAGPSPELRSLADGADRSSSSVDDAGAGPRPSADDGEPDRAARDADGVGEGTAGGPADPELTAVSGIGAAYAERLNDAGVETVGELALADPDRLAADSGIDTGRVERMVRRAREQVESG